MCAQRTEPINQTVRALNVNSSKKAKDTEFKFDAHVSMGSPDMITYFLEKWAWPGSRDPQMLLALNVYS